MKDSVLNFRVKESTKIELELLSCIQDTKMSELSRTAIEEFIEKRTSVTIVEGAQVSLKDFEIFQSFKFVQFVMWLYDKRRNPEFDEINEFYYMLIDLIRELNKNPIVHELMRLEFDKVRRELVDYMMDTSQANSLSFPKSKDKSIAFDYEEFAYFIFALEYDDDNNQVIHLK